MSASPLVSSQTLLATCSSTNYGVVAGCTTEARNTHKTEFREVEYRWHPWHGQRVLVRGEARRGGIVVLQCVRDELKGFPTLEIPEWMFDSSMCSRMKPAESPRVDCAALLALKQILSATTECSERDMVQAQHDSSSSGDADAQTIAVQDPSRRLVFSPSEAPRVPAEVRQKMARLLARMLNEHLLHRSAVVRPEVSDE